MPEGYDVLQKTTCKHTHILLHLVSLPERAAAKWVDDLRLVSRPPVVFRRTWLEADCVCHRGTAKHFVPKIFFFFLCPPKINKVRHVDWKWKASCVFFAFIHFFFSFSNTSDSLNQIFPLSLSSPITALPSSSSSVSHSPTLLYPFNTSLLPSASMPCRLSLLFTKYSLTKKKWDFLLIEHQSSKVSSSTPAPSISRP